MALKTKRTSLKKRVLVFLGEDRYGYDYNFTDQMLIIYLFLVTSGQDRLPTGPTAHVP